MCHGNGSTVCLLGLPVNCADGSNWRAMVWSKRHTYRSGRDGSAEKRKQELATLSTSSSCLIAREQPTIKQLPIGENVVKNLFVGNLDPEVTHEELRRLFEAHGQVVQVHIIVDRDTGLPRGFAFVEMTNDAEAEKAIKALNGSMLRDRTLDVDYARPRPESPAA